MKNIKWKPYIIAGSVALGGAAIGAGISLGVVVPQALEAKAGLEELIPSGGPANSLNGKEKIKYVAIGDSATAGYNGLIGQTTQTTGNSYRSYSDFLAGSFKKAGRMDAGDYHNLAISGGRLADISKDLFENPTTQRLLAEADLITLTIGANDILAVLNMLSITNFYNFKHISSLVANGFGTYEAYLKALGAGETATAAALWTKLEEYPFLANFSSFDPSKDIPEYKEIAGGISETASDEEKAAYEHKKAQYDNYYRWGNLLSAGTPSDHEYETDYITADEVFGNDTDFMVTKADSVERFTQTASQITQLLSGNPEPFLNLDKDWNSQIFKLIKGQVALLTKHLHDVAPKAKIVFLGYAFPFEQFPDSLINEAKPALGGLSLAEAYDYLLSEIKAGTQLTADEPNRYVSFVNANELNAVKTANQASKDLDYTIDFEGADGVFGGYPGMPGYDSEAAKDDQLDKVAAEWKSKIMPNITDIHPSVYGYDKIAEGLFQILGADLGLTNQQITANTQHSTEFKMTVNDKDGENLVNTTNYVDPWTDWRVQDEWARLDEDPRLFKTQAGMMKWKGDQMFYEMLSAPAILKTNLKGNNFSMSDMLEGSLKEISDLINATNITKDSKAEDFILTKAKVATSVKGKFELANGLKFGDLLANRLTTKEADEPQKVKNLLDKFEILIGNLIDWSTDIFHIKQNLVKNQSTYNESEVFAYAENGAIASFASFQEMLLSLTNIETAYSDLVEDQSK